MSLVDEGVLRLVLAQQSADYVASLRTLQKVEVDLADDDDNTDTSNAEEILIDPALSATERRQVSLARKGQGRFKRNLRQIKDGCRLTGVMDNRLLVASHILPWRHCLTSHQRLDGNNGLLLSPSADALFDRGLVSFTEDGRVLVSDKITTQTLEALGFGDLSDRSVGSFSTEQALYLQKHRELYGFQEAEKKEPEGTIS